MMEKETNAGQILASACGDMQILFKFTACKNETYLKL